MTVYVAWSLESRLHFGGDLEVARMRLLLPISTLVFLFACAKPPKTVDVSESPVYKPHPAIAVSSFAAGSRIASVYVRHSKGDVLLHLAPVRQPASVSNAALKLVLPLQSASQMRFAPIRYENFDSSTDVFQDGSVVIVPLNADTPGWLGVEDAGNDAQVGVFINLLSGKRYFFAGLARSPEARIKIGRLRNRWPEITVVVPEDLRAHVAVPRFPDFQQ
jgi:hypothetical protein